MKPSKKMLNVPAGGEADRFTTAFDFFGSGTDGFGWALDGAEDWPVEAILALEALFGSASVNSGSAAQTEQI